MTKITRDIVLTLILVFSITALLAVFFSFRMHRNHPSDPQGTASTDKRPEVHPSREVTPSSGPFLEMNQCTQIHELVCQKRGTTKDPTGVVRTDVEGEKKALRIYERIIHEHRNWTSSQIDEALVQEIFTEKNRKRLYSAFYWVQDSFERFIEGKPDTVICKDDKKKLITRLRSVELQLPPPASVYADEPDLLTKNDVYFERIQNGHIRLRVGGAYVFVAKSWFNLIFTFGHELAHSIDPCELKAARIDIPAYQTLTDCFFQNHLVAQSKEREECGDGDWLSETFADWMAVHATAESLTNFSKKAKQADVIQGARNAVRDLCDQDEDEFEVDTELHPYPRIRIEKIFGEHPEIRRLIGCGESAGSTSYCSFERK